MKNKLLEQTKHTYSEKQRMGLLAGLAPIFLLLLPFLILFFGTKLDQALGWSAIFLPPVNAILGIVLIICGLGLALWTIYVQFTIGRGTPVPVMATQKLIVQAPYTLCRNPMALGTTGAYVGVGVGFGSPGAVLMAFAFIAALLVYIKQVEEKEMEARFGQEYLNYRRSTPFLFPRLWKRQ